MSSFHMGPGQAVLGKGGRLDLIMALGGGRLVCRQFHEDETHQVAGHVKDCHYFSGVEPFYDSATNESDRFNGEYAKFLSQRTHLQIDFESVPECHYFHTKPGQKTLPEIMRDDERYVLVPNWIKQSETEGIEQEALVQAIVKDEKTVNGFIVIQGSEN